LPFLIVEDLLERTVTDVPIRDCVEITAPPALRGITGRADVYPSVRAQTGVLTHRLAASPTDCAGKVLERPYRSVPLLVLPPEWEKIAQELRVFFLANVKSMNIFTVAIYLIKSW